ncbi:bifunctional serine/threonine-protein kinase/ABC transporter substrate-binding protein [Streptomyces sp. NPDC086669]|uniref:bifunctional serine/threonine-protein kinase/ABC transporter substrate-binding protein n=1 Tax=Streptomyces sp. NPDC086669 TaxID=3365753 RepID=UPI00380F0744
MTEQNPELIAGRYELVERIGQGGMGRVWRAQDRQLFGREVAVKEILFPPGMDDDERATLVGRFTGEARAAVVLSHPGIITIHDVVEHRGAPVIVMEFVRGASLAAAIRAQGRLPVRRVAEIGAIVLDALTEAHRSRIVHRDIKPDNVLLAKDRVVLTDFGIAHLADATTKLSRSGIVIGTPQYMPPEQLEGKRPTPANDLWALGATLYHAVEGQPPFDADGLHALAVAVFTRPHRPPVHAGPLAPVLDALLVKDPAQRVGAAEAGRMLASVLRSLPAAEEADERGRAPEAGQNSRKDPTLPAEPSPPSAPSAPRVPTVPDSGSTPVDPRRPSGDRSTSQPPVPDRPTSPPPVPGPVPPPPTEDLVSLKATAEAEAGDRKAGRAPVLTRRSVILGAALATLAAGSALTWTLSGDNEKPHGGGAAGNSAEGSAVTVAIGVDAPLTGALAELGLGVRNSADLAVRTANEKKVVPGVRFEIKAVDDAGDPAKGATNAAGFVSDAKVLGVVGPVSSSVAESMVPRLAEAELANVSPANTSPVLTLGPDWASGTKVRPHDTYFRTLTSDADEGPFAARYLRNEAGKGKLYVVDDRTAYSTALVSGFTAEFEKLGGSVVGREHVDTDQRGFSGLVAKVRASGADAVFFGGYYDTAGALSRQLGQAGVDVPLMGGDGIYDQQYLTSGPEVDGDLAVHIGVPAEQQAKGADFLARYRKAGYAEPAGWYGPYAYDAAWSIIEAVKVLVKANDGTLPGDARARMSEAVSRLAFDGVTGRVAFDGYGDTRNRRLTVLSVESGRWTSVTSGPAAP